MGAVFKGSRYWSINDLNSPVFLNRCIQDQVDEVPLGSVEMIGAHDSMDGLITSYRRMGFGLMELPI